MKQIQFENGSLYLEHDVYNTYFKSVQSVALLRKEKKYLLMPVQQAGSGLLLKIRNARGDRVIHAHEFFQNHGVDINESKMLDVEWNPDYAALTFEIPE